MIYTIATVLTLCFVLAIQLSRAVNPPLAFAQSGAGDLKSKPEEFWKEKLTPEEFHVCRERGTERPFSGKLLNNKEDGTYTCAACGAELFSSDTKFDSGTGWPSFSDVMKSSAVELLEDRSHGMVRTEVRCAKCSAHLGHVFNDGPTETGKRYCINSVALDFAGKK